MAAQVFSCPECDHRLRTNNPIAAGKKVRCPRCQAVFPVPASGASSASTGIKKPAGAKTDRSAALDDEVDEAPVKKRRDEAIVPPRKVKPPPRDEEIDDEDEDEEEERPRKKKKKKPPNRMPLILALSGVAALLLVFVLTAFLWPGFLRSDSKAGSPKGPPVGVGGGDPAGPQGPADLLAYVPADSVTFAGINVALMRKQPDFARDLEKAKNLLAALGMPAELVDLFNEVDQVLLAGKLQVDLVCALSTTNPVDEDKLKRALKAGPPQTVQGRTVYRIQGTPVGFAIPSSRVVLITDFDGPNVGKVLGATKASVGKEVEDHVRELQKSMAWALVLNKGEIRKHLGGLKPADVKKAVPGAEKLLPGLQNAHAAFLTMDSPSGKDFKLKVGLVCAEAKDAGLVKTQVQNLWKQQGKGFLNMARDMLKILPGLEKAVEPVNAALNDVEKSFNVEQKGAEVTVSVHITEKTMQQLEKMMEDLGGQFNPGFAPEQGDQRPGIRPGRPGRPPGR